jgi:hypothetical protein
MTEGMMTLTHNAFLAAACFLGLTVATAGSASAIECDGNFQVQRDGNLIATPFCQDGYLAIVAREYGMKVSARSIRSDYGEKQRACRLVGDDNRVRDTCSQYRYRQFQRRIHR